MKLKLIYDPTVLPANLKANEGFDLLEIQSLLQKLEQLGVAWEAIETSAMPEAELSTLYLEAITPAVHHKYQIRQVFGTKRHSGFMFGKAVPALLVYEANTPYPSHVYPHRAKDRIVTAMAFLNDLIKKLERAPMTGGGRKGIHALVERMDRLREKIGPIGLPVAELIREGRRR